MGACHFAETFFQMAGSEAAAVFVTSCDQMRRAADQALLHDVSDVFLMNVPATWQTPAAKRLYRSEIKRLGTFLVRIGGVPPSPDVLAAEMRHRACLRMESLSNCVSDEDITKIPLAIVGESLLPSNRELIDLIGSSGCRVALDATSNGERIPFLDEAQMGEDPFAAMIDGYFNCAIDVFQRPNTRMYGWLRQRVSERGIRGLILWHYSWCDLWRAEAGRLRDEFHLPILHLEAGGTMTSSMKTRMEVFLEILNAS